MVARLLLAGVLLGAMVLLPAPADAWQVGACVYVDTTATAPSQPCVARSGGPSLSITCHAYSGVTQVPLATLGATLVVTALACT